MRHSAGGFGHQQALVGSGQIDPPPGHFPRQTEIVSGRIEAEQRQAKPVFAARGPVATAHVAARLHEDRHHIQLKADRRFGRGVLHDDRNIHGLPAVLDMQLSAAVGQRREAILFGAELRRIGNGERRLGRHVASQAVGVFRLHDQGLEVARVRQVHVGRIDVDGHGGGILRAKARSLPSTRRSGRTRLLERIGSFHKALSTGLRHLRVRLVLALVGLEPQFLQSAQRAGSWGLGDGCRRRVSAAGAGVSAWATGAGGGTSICSSVVPATRHDGFAVAHDGDLAEQASVLACRTGRVGRQLERQLRRVLVEFQLRCRDQMRQAQQLRFGLALKRGQVIDFAVHLSRLALFAGCALDLETDQRPCDFEWGQL